MSGHPSRRQALGLGAGLIALGAQDAMAAEAQAPAFTLLLVNDVYLMGEVTGRGGLARLNAIVKAERARGVPVLYAHAGDALSPSLMSGFDRGAHMIDLLNLAPPDVFVPGNHEFDFGPSVFAQRMAQARFPCFAANLRDGDGRPLPGLRDRAVVALGGVRVGILGIALAATPEKSQAAPLRFGPEIETLRREADALRAEGAQIVVAVAHTERPVDDRIVRERLVDILLSGHDHDLCIRDDGRTVMVESGHDAQVVTAVDVHVSPARDGAPLAWRARVRLTDSADAAPDPETLAVVNRLEASLARELDVPVGAATVDLDSRVAAVRMRESSFGDLVADALRAAARADVGLMNGGGIRGNRLYTAGTPLTRRDILTELPFGNTTVLVAITGAILRAALENGYRDLGTPSGRFLQVSGIAVTLDPAAAPGSRVVAAEIDGAPLDPGRTYTVAANNFMLEGGNDYGMLRDGRILVGGTDGRLLAGEVIAYVEGHAPVTVPAGRIRVR